MKRILAIILVLMSLDNAKKSMKVIHLERAAAMLEVVGCFVQDRDEPTPLTIRSRLKMFKARAGLEDTEE